MSPLYVIESVVAVKRLVRVNRVEEVSFQLPGDWQSNGKQCVAVLYEVPALVDVDPVCIDVFGWGDGVCVVLS